MADRLLSEGMTGYAKEVLPKMLAPVSIERLPDVAEQVRLMMLGTDPIGAAAAVRGRAERPDYEETLARLDVPALVVVGDQDAFTARTDAEQMHALLKGSEFVWIKGVGHMPNLERTGQFNEAVEGWLGRVRQAR
jgi:pimeloyl-ACP methyl ester carboxylesterase